MSYNVISSRPESRVSSSCAIQNHHHCHRDHLRNAMFDGTLLAKKRKSSWELWGVYNTNDRRDGMGAFEGEWRSHCRGIGLISFSLFQTFREDENKWTVSFFLTDLHQPRDIPRHRLALCGTCVLSSKVLLLSISPSTTFQCLVHRDVQ